MSTRESALQSWLSERLPTQQFTLSLLAGDASFRRYYRINHQGKSWVVMDAPPEREPITAFLAIDHLLNSHGLHVPRIEAATNEMGFILMEDLGDALFLDLLTKDSANELYQHALDLLVTMQSIPTEQSSLSHYDSNRLLTELHLFIDWFCLKYLALDLHQQEITQLTEIFTNLAQEVANQASCFVHRDYHSRNIMAISNHPIKLSIIDFQDAVIGPYTYDVVSLLKDCYIDWPSDQQQQWCHYYFKQSAFHENISFDQFMLDYHLCGLQRHLRVLGTFSRLYLRDGKDRYLADMPRIMNYITHALSETGKYPALQQFFSERVKLP
ncbi:aminoglycoside phosphotransferase family protein [Legionella sp. W05-934-2]|jgi:aminoglycoside/choline kinase family phosphotransferase|uniref:aminoglycoside phosphotransferase family protein n=1 Tax=Legionella sp. W05-934-2 TaxID=1198649 RepID=UPI003461DB77